MSGDEHNANSHLTADGWFVLSDRYLTGRRSERIPVRVPANLTIESEGAKIRHEIFTVDVSQHGLRVASHIALSPEQVVEIFPHSAPAYSARCRVVWVGKPGSAQYGQAGLEFVNPPPGLGGGEATAWPVFGLAH